MVLEVNSCLYPALSFSCREIELQFVPVRCPIKKSWLQGRCIIRLRVQPADNRLRALASATGVSRSLEFWVRIEGKFKQLTNFKVIQE
jgi:hypothetical protein